MAADLGMPVRAPAVVLVDDWSGFYVGAEVGYGWGRQRFDDTFNAGALDPFDTVTLSEPNFVIISRVFLPNFGVPLATVKQRGWLAGAFFGAQKQWGSLVLGIEADIDAANIKGSVDTAVNSQRTLDSAIIERATVLLGGTSAFFDVATFGVPGGAPNATVTQTSTIDSKIDALGTLRAKVGFAPSREWMIYGTGGLAWAHTVTTLTATQTVTGSVAALVPPAAEPGVVPFSITSTISAQSPQTLLGWSAGVGMDWKLTPNVVLGALYLH